MTNQKGSPKTYQERLAAAAGTDFLRPIAEYRRENEDFKSAFESDLGIAPANAVETRQTGRGKKIVAALAGGAALVGIGLGINDRFDNDKAVQGNPEVQVIVDQQHQQDLQEQVQNDMANHSQAPASVESTRVK